MWFAVVDAVVFGAKPRSSGNVGGAKPIRVVFAGYVLCCCVVFSCCGVLLLLLLLVFLGGELTLCFFSVVLLSVTKTNDFIGRLSCLCAKSSLLVWVSLDHLLVPCPNRWWHY